MHEEVTAAIVAAKAAGEVAMRYYRGGFEVTIKPDQTPVTQADREAEQAIKRVLGRAFPDHGFLGEELGEEGPGTGAGSSIPSTAPRTSSAASRSGRC